MNAILLEIGLQMSYKWKHSQILRNIPWRSPLDIFLGLKYPLLACKQAISMQEIPSFVCMLLYSNLHSTMLSADTNNNGTFLEMFKPWLIVLYLFKLHKNTSTLLVLQYTRHVKLFQLDSYTITKGINFKNLIERNIPSKLSNSK